MLRDDEKAGEEATLSAESTPSDQGEPPSGATGKSCIHVGLLIVIECSNPPRPWFIRLDFARDSSEVAPATKPYQRLSGIMGTVKPSEFSCRIPGGCVLVPVIRAPL